MGARSSAAPLTAQSVTRSELACDHQAAASTYYTKVTLSSGDSRKMDSQDHHQRKNASRFETLGSRNLMEQVKGARAKVDTYFGKVRSLCYEIRFMLCEAS